MSDFIDVQLTLPNKDIEFIESLVAQGILGESLSEVCEHILKQYLFEAITTLKKDTP